MNKCLWFYTYTRPSILAFIKNWSIKTTAGSKCDGHYFVNYAVSKYIHRKDIFILFKNS